MTSEGREEKVRVVLEFDSGEEYVRWLAALQDATLIRGWLRNEVLRTRDAVGREEDFA